MSGEDERIVAVRESDPLFAQVCFIRTQVFIVEQECPPEEEWDDKDAISTHFLALRGETALGTLRYFDDNGWLHIGRLAVLEPERGAGIAWRLLERCLSDGREKGFARSFLNAQMGRMNFYRRAGFHEVGEVFMEAGIRHMRMEMEM